MGIKALRAIPANKAAIGDALANFPIPKNKKSPKRTNKNKVSIDKNLNSTPRFFNLTNPIVRIKSIKRDTKVQKILIPGWVFDPTTITIRIKSKISMISSKVPIPIML